MDIPKLIANTDRYTLHSHTQFCDGRADMDTMARAALDAGMKIYGFTPHSPVPFGSPCNMRAEDVEAYMAECDRIKRDYGPRGCMFLTGMEIDYAGPEWGPHSDYFRSLGLDFSIGSVHFIPTQAGEPVDIDGRYEDFERKMRERFRNDIDYVVDTFYRCSESMVQLGGFDILGHFDKIAQNAAVYAPGIEDGEHYRSRVNALIDLIIDRGITIELNTKAWPTMGRFFPASRYLPHLVKAGVPIVVNSDAHYPDRINAGRDEGLALLRQIRLEHEN